jgi:hypothetical protein
LGSASPLGLHSYDLGASRTGVFWATAVPEGSVGVEFNEGEAKLHLENVCVLDAFTVPNSLDQTHPLGHPVAGVINSLTLKWSGISRRVSGFRSTDPQDKFAGDFIEVSDADIAVTATTLSSTGHGFRFVSDAPETTVKHFAQIGKEHNGVFF